MGEEAARPAPPLDGQSAKRTREELEMDDQQAKMVDEAAQKFAEAIMLMNRTGSGRPAEAQDRLARLTRSFVERVIGNLEAQAESDRVGSQRLAEQARG